MIFLCVSYQWGGQPMIRWAVKKASCIRKSRLGLRAARGEHTPLVPS